MSQVSSRPDTSQGQRRILHDKTSFGIIPTPPSPTHSSPPLTQSTSNSSVSSPHSSTPPPRYNRSRTRYPTDLGRVPLHRRGTSQTYEPFEDLLREAGYKETRVFTPEAERVAEASGKDASPAGQESKGSMRKVGAVVGFLTGLMPGAALKRSSSLRETYQPASIATPTIQEYSPPPSPMSQRQLQKQAERTSTPRSSISSIDGPSPTPKAKYRAQHSTRSSVSALQSNHPYAYHSNASYTSLASKHRHHGPQQSSTARLMRQYTDNQPESPPQMLPRALPGSTPTLPPSSPLPHEPRQITHTIYHPRPSRASAYLRHMASAPNMPHRPSSTPAHQSLLHAQQPQLYRSKSSRPSSRDDSDLDGLYGESSRGNGEGEEDHMLPPMPRTWLETVARAVLFGGAGAYIGGPTISSANSNHPRSTSNPNNKSARSSSTAKQTPALRQARSIISRVQSQDSRTASLENSPKYRGSRTHAHLQRTRSGLSDQTNRGHLYVPGAYSRSATATPVSGSSRPSLSPMKLDAGSLARPELLSRVGRGRSEASEGQVRKTRVVCRSAPTSRAGSRTRGGSGSGEGREKRRNESSTRVEPSSLKLLRDRGRKGWKGAERDTVPSLARTKTEGDDDWHGSGNGGRKGKRKMKKRHQYRSDEENRYLNGWAWHGSAEGGDASESGSNQSCSNSELDDDEEEEEEDGELDLAQMLVPPKRQNSIRSLRKHLVGSNGSVFAAPSNHGSTSVVGASGVASVGLMRRGSTRSSTVFDSGNSHTYRRWLAGDTMTEQWEDEVEGETGSGSFINPRASTSRRSTEDDELVIRLDNSSASRKSARLGLPAGWGFVKSS